MRRLLFSDLHLKVDRLEEQKEVLIDIIKIAKKEKINKMIFLGDLFDDRRNVNLKELLLFVWFSKRLSKEDIDLEAIPGNHDKPDNDSIRSYLSIFENKYNNVNIFQIPTIVEDRLFIPFLPEDKFFEHLNNEDIKKNKHKVRFIFMHNTFNGSLANSGRKMSSSIDMHNFKDFKNLERIFIGHYHNRQKLYDKKVLYIGNPMQLNFGEEVEKGITILDDETGKVKFVQTNYSKYKTFFLQCNLEDYKKAIQIVSTEVNNYIRIKFIDKKENLLLIPESEIQEKSKCKFLRIEREVKDSKKEKELDLNSFDKDIFVSFKEYSSKEKMDSKDIIYGVKILRQAFNEINEVENV